MECPFPIMAGTPVHKRSFLHIDRAKTAEHNLLQVFGALPVSLTPGTLNPLGFLLNHFT